MEKIFVAVHVQISIERIIVKLMTHQNIKINVITDCLSFRISERHYSFCIVLIICLAEHWGHFFFSQTLYSGNHWIMQLYPCKSALLPHTLVTLFSLFNKEDHVSETNTCNYTDDLCKFFIGSLESPFTQFDQIKCVKLLSKLPGKYLCTLYIMHITNPCSIFIAVRKVIDTHLIMIKSDLSRLFYL